MNNLYIFLFVLLLTSCKPVDYATSSKISTYLQKGTIDISFKGKIDIGKEQTVFGSIKIFNDSTFQIFLNSIVLGIEVARIQFRSDSVFFINKLEKKYYFGLLSNLKDYSCGFHSASELLEKLVVDRHSEFDVWSDTVSCNNVQQCIQYEKVIKQYGIYSELDFYTLDNPEVIFISLVYSQIQNNKEEIRNFMIPKGFSEIL